MPSVACVLVVEDDVDIREALVGLLEDEGYAVAGAANGHDALLHLRANPKPALILLDLMMPVMNGWQFRAEQRRDAAVADVPVIIISADGNLDEKARALDAAGFLRKPIELEHLLTTVAKFCAPAAGTPR